MSALSNVISSYGPHLFITTRFETRVVSSTAAEMLLYVRPVKLHPCFYRNASDTDIGYGFFDEVVDDD